SILSRLRPDDLAKLAGGRLPADPAPTVVRSVARLTAQSKRRGSLRSRRTGQRMELFEAPGYSLLVRPAGEMQGEIVAVRPEGEGELVRSRDPEERVGKDRSRVRGARATIQWAAPVPLNTATGQKKAGVYIVVERSSGAPFYLAQSGGIGGEWSPRLHILHVFGVPTENFDIYIGTISAAKGLTVKDTKSRSPKWTASAFKVGDRDDEKLLRQDVEQVLLRYFENSSLPVQKNQQAKKPIMSAPAGIEVRHTGLVPKFLQRPLTKATSTAKHVPGKPGEWITTVQHDTQFEVPWG
ncbi:MAG: hypothetical protein AVDCRST_MAG89-1588, partial [uncultured Gemmatimonadetes bacterium]